MSAIVQLVRRFSLHPSDPGSRPGGGICVNAVEEERLDGITSCMLLFAFRYSKPGLGFGCDIIRQTGNTAPPPRYVLVLYTG